VDNYPSDSMTQMAKTSDGQTPSEEEWCDDLSGAQFGLCVAYCEAMDCDYYDHNASDRGCERVLDNYIDRSGGDLPPCVGDGEPPENL